MKAHEHRADQLAWTLYVLAGVAAIAILAPIKWPKAGTGLAIVTLALSLIALGVGGYIAQAGGQSASPRISQRTCALCPARAGRELELNASKLLLVNAAKP